MNETQNQFKPATSPDTRPPVKWIITVKETDSTIVVQFPITQSEIEKDAFNKNKQT